MRRWLAIILLTLLPIQFSWAAVASYCEHETTTNAPHVGHHEHQHHADLSVVTDPGAADQKAPGSVDLDCGQCHGSCAAVPLPRVALLPLITTARPDSLADVFERAHAPTPPERPQWARLA